MLGYTVVFAGAIVAAGTFTACTSDTAGMPTATDYSTAYWSLALPLEQHAVVLALNDTLQLTATPKDASGQPLTGLGPVTYKVNPARRDTTVTVSATGLVTARYPSTGTHISQVIATLQVNGITHADTAFIVVPGTAYALDSLSIQPALGDSAKRALDVRTFSWPARVYPHACTSGCTSVVYYTSSNPLIAMIDPHTGDVTIQDTGTVTFTARALVNHVVSADSLRFRFTPELQLDLRPGFTADGVVGIIDPPLQKFVLGVGAVVAFENITVRYSGFTGLRILSQPWQITLTHADSIEATSWLGVYPPSGSGNIRFDCDTLVAESYPSSFPSHCVGVDLNNVFVYHENLKARRFPYPGVYKIQFPPFQAAADYEIDIVP